MLKIFSRKGAKAQSKFMHSKSPLAPLRLCGSILLLLCVMFPALSQRGRFDPDGTFWIHGDKPANFSEFDSINLNAKRSRHLEPAGVRALDTVHRYKTLIVKRDNLTFTTLAVRGISYSFSGKFLKGGVYSAGDFDDETPVLEGTLTRFRDGKKVAEANLKFTYFGGT